jgi:NAD(P)-dependent dehydrogenase (short-subunit alcohol dehydrogenase family)
MLLKGEIAVITGGASKRGIGRATAKLFAEHGARVAILDLDGEGAQEAARSLGPEHRGHRCDVTKRKEVEGAFTKVAQELGPPTVLVNNAGITQPRKIGEITDADYDIILDIHLRGTFLCSQTALPYMLKQKRGSIICISSVSAERGGGIFGGPHYCAAKAGILGLAKAIAREVAPDGIRVNAIAPGLIDTDISQGRLTDELKAVFVQSIPMGRIGQALDVARACLFLASPLSEYITGEVLDVNGGMHID